MILDHVALIVRELEPVLERLAPAGLPIGPVESFPSEGTREVYLGDPKRCARLLLLQPTGPGPYERALSKRGPGLHHVALAVPDLEAFPGSAPGWLLHPHSLASGPSASTLWFARPGVGTLLEVVAGAPQQTPGSLSVGVSVQDDALRPLLDFAGHPVSGLSVADGHRAWIQVGPVVLYYLDDLTA